MLTQKSEPSNLTKIMTFIGDVTGSLTQVSTIVEAIEMDHQDLKKFIRILKDEKAPSSVKRKVYPEFADLLTSHATSEELAMYSLSKKLTGLKQKTLEGYVEHKVANRLLKEIKRAPSHRELPAWLAQVQVLAELVEHHVEEEERDLLPEVKEQMSKTMQATSMKKFIKLRRNSQRVVTNNNAGVLAQEMAQ